MLNSSNSNQNKIVSCNNKKKCTLQDTKYLISSKQQCLRQCRQMNIPGLVQSPSDINLSKESIVFMICNLCEPKHVVLSAYSTSMLSSMSQLNIQPAVLQYSFSPKMSLMFSNDFFMLNIFRYCSSLQTMLRIMFKGHVCKIVKCCQKHKLSTS